MMVIQDKRLSAVLLAALAALAVTVGILAMRAHTARLRVVNAEDAYTLAQQEATRLYKEAMVQQAAALDARMQNAVLATQLADAMKNLAPVPPPPPAKPPADVVVALRGMDMQQPQLMVLHDADLAWNWGMEAQRVPGLTQAVADRDHALVLQDKLAQGYKAEAADAEAASARLQDAFGSAQKSAASAHTEAIEAKKLIHSTSAGLVLDPHGYGVYVDYDRNVFRFGAEFVRDNERGNTGRLKAGIVW